MYSPFLIELFEFVLRVRNLAADFRCDFIDEFFSATELDPFSLVLNPESVQLRHFILSALRSLGLENRLQTYLVIEKFAFENGFSEYFRKTYVKGIDHVASHAVV